MKPKKTKLDWRLATVLVAVICWRTLAAASDPGRAGWTPVLWHEFEREYAGSPLYDFSQAGYRGGQSPPRPPVTHHAAAFGAHPNDDQDDTTALQRALDAVAEQGGVLLLEEGVYDLGLRRTPQTLTIKKSHTILRGAGANRTTLRLHQRLFRDQGDGSSGDPLIQVGHGKDRPGRWRRRLVADTAQGGDILNLESTEGFNPGMAVQVLLFNPVVEGQRTDLLSRFLVAPLEPEAGWKHFARWAPLSFVSVVTDVLDNQRLQLRHPAPVGFETRWRAEVGWYDLSLREVGLEGFRVETPWTGPYRHHGSRAMDYGWTAIRLSHVRDGWVRDVHLHNLTQDVVLEGCLQSTVKDLVVTGTPGHLGVRSTGWHNLFDHIRYDTTRTHGAGANGQAIGNVFRRIAFARVGSGANSVSRLDHHGGGFPLCNLFEQVGVVSVAGGGTTGNMPHAGPRNVFWNIRVDASTSRPPGELFTGAWNYHDTVEERGYHRTDCHKLFPRSLVVGAVHADQNRRVMIDGDSRDRHDRWIRVEGLNRTGVEPVSLYTAQQKRQAEKRKATMTKKPNIVYILADDMGYGDLSCLNPDSRIRTVRLDELAAGGMICEDAHATSAVCTPSRYSILTGRYNWRSRMKAGVLNGWSGRLVEPGRMTVASFLRQHGYHTAMIGKWHLGWDWTTTDGRPATAENVDFSGPVANGPDACGFDYYYGHNGSLDMAPYVYVENGRITAPPDRVTEDTGKFTWWRKGPTGADFQHADVLPNFTRRGVQYIEERAATGQPFFLYFPLPAPHTPILPTAEFRGKSGTNLYGDFCLQVDDVVGQVMDALDRAGVADNTIVVFTADNGCSPEADFAQLAELGHRPSYLFRGHKADIYEGGHRIPLVVRWPATIRAGSVAAETVCLADLLATCADILGVQLPGDAGEDSVSNLPLWQGRALDKSLREATVHHSVDGSFSIRQGRWKLEMCAGSGGWSHPKPGQDCEGLPPIQLYDLDADIGERRNVQDEHPEVVEQLKTLLTRYVSDGRSTPGAKQANSGPLEWDQLWWMLRQPPR